MKRSYSRPVFYAEEYTFSSSIAKCAIDIDTTPALTIVLQDKKAGVKGTNLCAFKEDGDGHVYGGQNGQSGMIYEMGLAKTPATLFNDGEDKDGCYYDWDGRKNIVAQTKVNFAQSFYGTNSDKKNHAPGYEGAAFLS